MARASKNYINVSLDGDKGATKSIMKKFGVRSYPTVLFLKPDEEEIDRLGARDPESVRKQLDSIFGEYAKEAASVTWVDSIEEAKEESEDRLIFVFFYNDKKGSQLMQEHTLGNLHVLKVLGESFICAKVEYDRKSPEAKEYKVFSAPSMVVLNSEGKKINSISGAKKPKEAIRFLKKAIKTHDRKQGKKAY